MRLKGDQSGQYAVILAFLLPVLAAMFCAVMLMGSLEAARSRLQAALDRGMFAGAARLAFLMDRAGELAWEYHKAYRDLQDIFASTSQQSSSEGESKLNELQTKQQSIIGRIEELSLGMYENAHRVAYEVTAANLKKCEGWLHELDYQALSGVPGDNAFLVITADPVELSYDSIEGDFIDPSNTGGGGREVVPFIVKDGSYVAMAGGAEINVSVPAMQGVFGETIKMRAVSAAQPFGGSIGSFGLLGGDEVDEVASSEEGKRYRYHPSLISFQGVKGAFDVSDQE